MYHGKNDQKRKVDALNGKLTLTDYKVYQETTRDHKVRHGKVGGMSTVHLHFDLPILHTSM